MVEWANGPLGFVLKKKKKRVMLLCKRKKKLCVLYKFKCKIVINDELDENFILNK